MNKKKSKALAFLLAASLLVPSVNGIVSAAELENGGVESINKVVASQEVANPEANDTSQNGAGENADTQNPVAQNVAKIGDKEYTTLAAAINDATDGATVELMGDVTEDITVNKNITIDGQSKYTISGLTTLKNGKLQKITIQPNPNNANGTVLSIGSTEQTNITMDGVTVNYSVTKRSGASASTLDGNKAKIVIQNCVFTNKPNNGGNTINVSEWSYGLYMNGQNKEGSVLFTNNEFNGAFRTMLSSIRGNVTISNNKFINSVETVVDGPTSGAKAECTCITTSEKKASDNITITNNTFDNAGAFFFQTNANVSGNTFKGEEFPHYIQARGIIEADLDLRNNKFEMGNNAVCSMDTKNAEILLPVGEMAYNYWAWDSLEELTDLTKANLSNYKYSFENDKKRVYYPTSENALKAFINPNPAAPIIGVRDNEKVVISENITIGAGTSIDIPKGKNITIEVPAGKTLTLNSADAIAVSGNLTISGDGEVEIAKSGEVSVNKDATLNITTNVDNKGTIDNNGAINNGGRISNSGKLTNNSKINNSGKISNSGEIGNKGEISNSGTIATQEGGSIEGNDINKVGNGTNISPNDYKPVEIKEAYKSSNSITMSVADFGKFNELGEVEFTIVEGSATESRGGIWIRAKNGQVRFTGLKPNTKYTVFARYRGLENTEVYKEVSTLSSSSSGTVIPSKPIKPVYDHTKIVGSDRYDTAAKIADKLGSYDNVVLVNATSTMSDGLSASGLAGKEDSAILLTKKDSIPKVTMDRIRKVKKVYIIGGEAAISAKVANQITAAGIKVERIGGKNRVETSELVAKKIGNYKKAFVVNGFKGEADAMSASSVAAREEAPILLTNGKTSTHAKKSGVSYYVVGGNNVVNKSIANKYNAEVLAGRDRYATNREVIAEFYGASETLYFANGETLVDALTASTISKDNGLVLVGRNSDNKILNKKNTIQVGGMKFDVDFEK